MPWLGENFFPDTDSGQFILHVRAKTGTRIEETARLAHLVENSIRRVIPAQEVESILDNIGLPYSTINFMHSTSGLIGTADADILVSLKENHQPTADYVRELRKNLAGEFPGNTFYFLPADIVTQILNFGLPAPIDIQIEGADIQSNRQVADKIVSEISPGARHRGSAYPAKFRLSDVQCGSGSNESCRRGIHPARRRDQHVNIAER